MALLIEYYSQLFTSSSPHDLEHIVEMVQLVVSKEMRDALAKPYTNGMPPLKALGPNGMPPLFFQT